MLVAWRWGGIPWSQLDPSQNYNFWFRLSCTCCFSSASDFIDWPSSGYSSCQLHNCISVIRLGRLRSWFIRWEKYFHPWELFSRQKNLFEVIWKKKTWEYVTTPTNMYLHGHSVLMFTCIGYSYPRESNLCPSFLSHVKQVLEFSLGVALFQKM